MLTSIHKNEALLHDLDQFMSKLQKDADAIATASISICYRIEHPDGQKTIYENEVSLDHVRNIAEDHTIQYATVRYRTLASASESSRPKITDCFYDTFSDGAHQSECYPSPNGALLRNLSCIRAQFPAEAIATAKYDVKYSSWPITRNERPIYDSDVSLDVIKRLAKDNILQRVNIRFSAIEPANRYSAAKKCDYHIELFSDGTYEINRYILPYAYDLEPCSECEQYQSSGRGGDHIAKTLENMNSTSIVFMYDYLVDLHMFLTSQQYNITSTIVYSLNQQYTLDPNLSSEEWARKIIAHAAKRNLSANNVTITASISDADSSERLTIEAVTRQSSSRPVPSRHLKWRRVIARRDSRFPFEQSGDVLLTRFSEVARSRFLVPSENFFFPPIYIVGEPMAARVPIATLQF